MSFNIGENIGPYRIVEQLGQGGMATVYKAYHASLDRYVALKALHPAFNEDKTFASRFQREARVVARLEHPNIVPVYDYAEHENRPYLVMKYIEGDTLKAHMTAGPLSSDEIQKVLDAVGGALAYAHKQGILHRDIKPSNVLIATDGQIYLADFGLARIAQSGESTMSSDSIMGTPQYISPEQAMGKKDLDAGTDLYSFGVMLYEMVVGQVPFSADTPFAIIHDHIYTALPLPRTVNPNVPESVERVLLKSLAKERADRYEDANVMIQAFKESWNQAGVPMQGTPIKLGQPLKPVEKNQTVAEPTKMGVKPPVKKIATPAPKTKSSAWIWISAGLVILLCLGIALFVRSNRLLGRFFAASQPLSTATQLVATQETSPTLVPQNTLPSPPPPPPPDSTGGQPQPPGVADAQKRANDHPKDLNAQLDLALAYWNANMQRQTFDTIHTIIQLAGPDNHDYYLQAGDKFKSQNDGWLPAARLYYEAIRFYSATETPENVHNTFREALYKSANRQEMPLVMPMDEYTHLDPPMALIAQARHSFFTGRKKEAFDLLGKAKSLENTMREAALLEGEFAALDHHPDLAKPILNQLVEDTGSTPEWIRLFAQQLLNGIK